MTRGPLSFKESDLVRAIKSAIKAGLQVASFKITKTGDIVVHAEGAAKETDDSWDKVLGHEDR